MASEPSNFISLELAIVPTASAPVHGIRVYTHVYGYTRLVSFRIPPSLESTSEGFVF